MLHALVLDLTARAEPARLPELHDSYDLKPFTSPNLIIRVEAGVKSRAITYHPCAARVYERCAARHPTWESISPHTWG